MPTAIVLSGGGAKGDFEVGAVRFLYDSGVRPDILGGVSVGAINAAKLAEGEDPNDPTRGLSGLEAIWTSLRSNSDMYVEAAWLSDPKLHPELKAWLIGTSDKLDIEAPNAPGPNPWGDLGNLVTLISGAAFLITDGQSLLESFRLILTEAKSIYELTPIADKLKVMLDPVKVAQWASAGRQLRLGTVALESGRLRYVTESGAVIETDGSAVPGPVVMDAACAGLADDAEQARGELQAARNDVSLARSPAEKQAAIAAYKQARLAFTTAQRKLDACLSVHPSHPVPLVVPLATGVLASASMPSIFHTVAMGTETYVDGGIREILPLQAVVDLGADEIYAVSASPVTLPAAATHFGGAGIATIASRALTEIAIHEVSVGDFVVHPMPGRTLPAVHDIHPDVEVHGFGVIDPGLIQINRDYGYMRAADVVAGIDPDQRRYQLATVITQQRAAIWALENRRAGQPNPNTPAVPADLPRPELGAEIDAAKTALATLLQERRDRGGPLPAGIELFAGRPELHGWQTPFNDARVVAVTPPPENSAPGSSVPATVVMRNTGTTTWTATGAYALGSAQPRDNTTWGFGRVALAADVPPGGQAVFELKVTVPAPPSAPFSWQLVQDGVEWFGPETPLVTVKIAEPARCAPIRTAVHGNQAAIRGLQGQLSGLDPRDPLDRAEIREIHTQVAALEKSNAALRAEGASLGCTQVP
jgi:NTE family protein